MCRITFSLHSGEMTHVTARGEPTTVQSSSGREEEFPYLRMVIVTTAVYWRLSSQLRHTKM
ncbi:conserved hypothetical protein [Streptomyces albidoflavus]|nr:conserved hypothetical protein [Streptomyces albidoflavus]